MRLRTRIVTEQESINCLSSDLMNFLTETGNGALTKEDALRYFSDFMKSAGIDSRKTVKVLEQFGIEGKEAALTIKVNEGW